MDAKIRKNAVLMSILCFLKVTSLPNLFHNRIRATANAGGKQFSTRMHVHVHYTHVYRVRSVEGSITVGCMSIYQVGLVNVLLNDDTSALIHHCHVLIITS